MVPITANILQPLVDVFESVLKFFHDSIGASWGLSIILLTIVVRAALLPLAVKQFRSMQSLQRIAPHLKVLQEKYKDDKQRLQQETMKFYQENKINPFGSCLPLVAQLPVFLSLFYMLRQDLRVDICGQSAVPCGEVPPGNWGESWWFVPDITSAAHGGVLVALLVLYVGSQLLSSLLMPATVDRNQRFIFMALPFFFVPFIHTFPAGLIMYWITTNLWTVGQQTILRRRFGHAAVDAREAAKVGGAAPAGAAAIAGDGNGSGAGDPPPVAEKPKRRKDPAPSENGEAAKPRAGSAPPPPPRRKKKRSGRRR